MTCNYKGMHQCIHVHFTYKCQPSCTLRQPLLNLFIGQTDNDKCNMWGLEAAAIPRKVKV